MYRKVTRTVTENVEVRPDDIVRALTELNHGLSPAQQEAGALIIRNAYHGGPQGIREGARQVLSALIAVTDGIESGPTPPRPEASFTLRVSPIVGGFRDLMRIQDAIEKLPEVRSVTVNAYARAEAVLLVRTTLARGELVGKAWNAIRDARYAAGISDRFDVYSD